MRCGHVRSSHDTRGGGAHSLMLRELARLVVSLLIVAALFVIAWMVTPP
jgi:hypothetical protein